jgi:hypothetical protein
MSDPKDWPGRTHYDDCWQNHIGCARDLIEQYSIELAQWRSGSAHVNGKLLAEIERLTSVADSETKLREGSFAEIERLTAEGGRLREALDLISKHGGTVTKEGLVCSARWCAEQARSALLHDQPDPLASKDHDLARQASGWDANGAPVED